MKEKKNIKNRFLFDVETIGEKHQKGYLFRFQ